MINFRPPYPHNLLCTIFFVGARVRMTHFSIILSINLYSLMVAPLYCFWWVYACTLFFRIHYFGDNIWMFVFARSFLITKYLHSYTKCNTCCNAVQINSPFKKRCIARPTVFCRCQKRRQHFCYKCILHALFASYFWMLTKNKKYAYSYTDCDNNKIKQGVTTKLKFTHKTDFHVSQEGKTVANWNI